MTSLPAAPSQLAATASGGGTGETVLFEGFLLKAGDDNSRWKSRYIQLLLVSSKSIGGGGKMTHVLRYFESKPAKTPRGEILASEITGISVFPSKTPGLQQHRSAPDANVQLLGELTSDHVQEGPTKLLIFFKTKLWRLAELPQHPHVIGDLIRALDRIVTQQISRFSIRMVGWMRAQGSLSWNRRYALLFSNGELLMFLDQTLDHLRRRIDLSKALEIRPKQPLASSGSLAEKRVLRMLNSCVRDSNNTSVWSVDMSDILGIRLLHPLIPEKLGYIMCVERASLQEDSVQLYARFRKWIVQLQLAAAESRLSGFAGSEPSAAARVEQQKFSLEDDEDSLLERKLLQLCHQTNPTDVARTIAWEYLIRFGSFPLLHRSTLWLVLFNGQQMKRTMNTVSYSGMLSLLVDEGEGELVDEIARIKAALVSCDVNLESMFCAPVVQMFLQQGGEENTFWTFMGAANSLQDSNMLAKRHGFAFYVESHVILDLLGMKHPQLVAHLNSYDLTKSVMRYLSDDFLPTLGCSVPQIWDGACAIGVREALSFCAVYLLFQRAGEFLECFSVDDLLVVVRRALQARLVEERFPWRDFDLQVAQRLRKAQWNALVMTMREHSQMLKTWKQAGEECQVVASRTVSQCNRFAVQEQDLDFDKLHYVSVQLHEVATELAVQAEACERALEHRMLRAVGGSSGRSNVSSASNSNVLTDFGTNEDANIADASQLVSKVQELATNLTKFAMTCLTLGWRVWCEANQMASKHRFIPRASLASSFYPTNSSSLPSGATTTASGAGGSDDHQDVSSIKSLANEIRRRLFNNPSQAQQQQPASSSLGPPSLANSGPPSPTSAAEKLPIAPALEPAASPQFLLAKFNGGFIGLCDFAGSSVDAAFSRDKQVRNVKLIRLLDILDVAIKVASFSSSLQRWLARKCAHTLPDCKRDMPFEMQNLFLSGTVQFNREEVKTLESALVEIQNRCSAGAKNCVV